MPRTRNRTVKQPRESLNESDMIIINDFVKQSVLRDRNFEADSKMSLTNLQTCFDLALTRLPSQIRKLTLNEVMSIENEKENDNEVTSSVSDSTVFTNNVKATNKTKRITTTSDDGYVTESASSTVKHKSRATNASNVPPSTRRTRSSSKNSRNKKPTFKQSLNVQPDAFKTPAVSNKMEPQNYGLITPKVKPNTPLSILRRPRQGEMVVSMHGSPILVSGITQDRTANINVPMRNGAVISLLPTDGLRLSHIPTFDNETLRQLQTLKGHIEKVISSKEK
ncbi:borealin-like [Prorops nasuta]|uniref:borealin-like n=1 Tax=Prorops nasuta TaxID=863751 RepID=UPI0034CE6A1D